MPLDPQTDEWLTALADRSHGKELCDLPVDKARIAFDRMSADAGLPPVEIADITDRAIPGPGGDIGIRVYAPEGTGPFPVLIYYPGGGFVVGSPDSTHGPCTVWARQVGAVVVSVNYRKGPEDPFPAAVDDAIAVTRWVADNAAEFGGDPSRIAVGGDSAGGNLATDVAIDARDNDGPALVGQVLIYPATDISRPYPSLKENGAGYFLTKNLLRWFGANYAADPGDWRASPMLLDDLSGLAPAFVVTAEYDPLRDQGEAYAQRLADAGIAVRTHRYGGQIHAFVGNLGGVTGQGEKAVNDISEFLSGVFAIE